MITPYIGGPVDDAVFHRPCFALSIGVDPFPKGYGANYRRPVIRVRHADLTLDDPEESHFRVVCPVCSQGVLRVGRDQTTLRLKRSDYCSRCVQRFWYTDNEIAGELMPGIGDA